MTLRQSYEDTPYPSSPFVQTHPDRLAVVATLLGMKPAPVERCRVLELGCAGGGNIIPMAWMLPESTFVGVDFSAAHIQQAQEFADAIHLTNIHLHHLDLRDVDPTWGKFDYIIVHGLYSWVPPEVQDKILEICAVNLAPQGIAYVSYNTFPGWKLPSAARDMMVYFTRQIEEPEKRAEQALLFLQLIADSISKEDNKLYSAYLSDIYRPFFQTYARMIEGKIARYQPPAFLHDELGEINEPLYFHEFIARAAQHQLQYLAESEFFMIMPDNFPPPIYERLMQLASDVIEMEQYMDYLRNRTFRKTLLCHQTVTIDRFIAPERLYNLYVATRAGLDENAGGRLPPLIDVVRSANGDVFTIEHALTQAAFSYLIEISPRSVSFAELVVAACARLDSYEASNEDKQVLASTLLQAYSYSYEFVNLYTAPPKFVVEVTPLPVASSLARWQSQNHKHITNQCHEQVELRGLDSFLLPLLDGSHSTVHLVDKLMELYKEGRIEVEFKEAAQASPAQVHEILASSVADSLASLARRALLIA